MNILQNLDWLLTKWQSQPRNSIEMDEYHEDHELLHKNIEKKEAEEAKQEPRGIKMFFCFNKPYKIENHASFLLPDVIIINDGDDDGDDNCFRTFLFFLQTIKQHT